MARPSNGHQLKERDGIWYIHWSESYKDEATGRLVSRSKRRSTGTGDRKKAEQVLAGFILERDKSPEKKDIPIVFFLEDYYEEHAKNLPSRDAANTAIEHLSTHAQSDPISIIDRNWCRLYANKRREGKIGRVAKDGTIRREMGVLVASINHAARNKKISKYDLPYVFLPDEPPGKDVWLRKEEADKLCENCITFETRLFVEIALCTWARKRAIETLTIFQVDLDRGQINFNPPGRKQTKKRRPTVPISERLRPWIVEAVQKAKEAKSEYLFIEPSNRRKGFTASVRRAGLKKKVTPHTLRHTGATWAAQRRIPMWEIAGVLGDSIKTTEKRYAHHHPDYLRDAVNFNNENVNNGVGNDKESSVF